MRWATATGSASATAISPASRWQSPIIASSCAPTVPIWDEYKKIVARHDARGAAAFGSYERFEFYDEARKTYCILQSGETAIYANIILQKGVIK